MILSKYNSFDYRKDISVPFNGVYELVESYIGIYIYVNTDTNDIINVYYDNINNLGDPDYLVTEQYTVNNEEKTILLSPKLKYFKLNITTNGDSSATRVVNTYYLDEQTLSSGDSSLMYGEDSSGNQHVVLTDASGKILVNVDNTITTTTSFNATYTDAFGRLRISNPFTIFDAKNVNVKNPRFTEYTSGSGVITYDVSASLVNLTCNSGAGMAVRESKNCFSYQPGKSLLILNSFVMNAATANVSQKVGYFDSNNGIYLDLSGDTLYISKRSMSTGTVITTSIAQSSWNVNTLPSLDITKAQIFWMDIEWLGVGSVRTGFVIDDQFIICHVFRHANIVTLPYMTTAQLPIRYEINSTSASVTLKQICSTVISEGGYEGSSIIRHAGSEASKFTLNSPSGTRTPLIALRLNANKLNSIILPSQLSTALATPNDIAYYELLLNPTLTTTTGGAIFWNTFTDGDGTVSAVEYALDHSLGGSNNLNTVTGGTIINSGYLVSHNVINLTSSKDFNLQLGRSFNGSSSAYTSDYLVLSISRLTISTDCYAVMGWYEL